MPLAELEGYALFEPIPLRPHRAPIVVPERVQPERKDALVYLADVYQGDGLKGVPRGAVKALRVYANHYAYPNMGGHIHIGIDGPWDVKRILAPCRCGRMARRCSGAGQHAAGGATARCRGEGAAGDAELDDRDAGRDAVLRWLPRAAE